MRWFIGGLPFILVFLVACSAAPDLGTLPESPLLRNLERKSGLIAYIGVDGNVYTIDQGGGKQTALTSDAKVSQTEGALRFYQFPTWSWDSQRIAFIAVDRSQNTITSASLMVANADGGEQIELFNSSNEFPFYVYWPSNNQHISFLTSSANNLILRLVSASGGDSTIIDVGQPYYWSWSPDGQNMLVNVGGPAESDPNAHIAFLSLSDQVQERRLGLTPHSFQAPAWSPKGDRLLLAAQSETGEGVLYLTDLQGSPIRELTSYQGQIAFGWSPNGERVAYIVKENGDPQKSGRVTIISSDGSSETRTSAEEGVLAFYWSPDSQKLAYLFPYSPEDSNQGAQSEGQQGQAVLLVLNILDISTGNSRTVATFQPTQQFLTILPTFDQFQHSSTIWSPSSEHLVLSATDQDGSPGIWVVPASGRLPARFITPGIIGFWSWK